MLSFPAELEPQRTTHFFSFFLFFLKSALLALLHFSGLCCCPPSALDLGSLVISVFPVSRWQPPTLCPLFLASSCLESPGFLQDLEIHAEHLSWGEHCAKAGREPNPAGETESVHMWCCCSFCLEGSFSQRTPIHSSKPSSNGACSRKTFLILPQD